MATGIASATNENIKDIAAKDPNFGEGDGLAFNLDRFFDQATPDGQAPEKVTDDRYHGQVQLGDETINVEGGEALYKGKLYKVGDDGTVFDGSLKAIGNIIDGKVEAINKASDVLRNTLGDGRRAGGPDLSKPQAIIGRDGKPIEGQFTGIDKSQPAASPDGRRAGGQGKLVTGSFDEISKLLNGDSNIPIEDLLVGGQLKSEKDDIKRGIAKKLLNFFT